MMLTKERSDRLWRQIRRVYWDALLRLKNELDRDCEGVEPAHDLPKCIRVDGQIVAARCKSGVRNRESRNRLAPCPGVCGQRALEYVIKH